MARYWVGNGGNWNDTTHWSASSGGATGASEPDNSQDVFFDANSFSSAGQTVTVNTATATCRDMDWTGATNTPTLNFGAGGTRVLNIFGSLTFITGMILSDTGGDGNIEFESTSTGKAVTTAGREIVVDTKFLGDGGSWTLQDSLTLANDISLTVGSNLSPASILNTNGKTVTIGGTSTFVVNANATLTLGTSTISLSGNGTTKFSISGTLNMNSATINYANVTSSEGAIKFNSGSVVDPGTSTIALNGTGGSADDFIAGIENAMGSNLTLNNLTVSGSSNYLLGEMTFNAVTLNSGCTLVFDSFTANTYTITTLTALGLSSSHIIIRPESGGGGEKTTLSASSVSIQFVEVKDNIASGAASPFTNSQGTDLGGNTNWNFTSFPAIPGALEINPKMKRVTTNKPLMERIRKEKSQDYLIIDSKPRLYA